MKIRRIRIILWAIVVVATPLSGFFALQLKYKPQIGTLTQSFSIANADELSPTAGVYLTAQELRQVGEIELRRPLHDAPPAPPPEAPAPKPIPPLDIRLMGTIWEPGHCRAMVQFPDGSIQLKSVGDKAGNAKIVAIIKGTVTIEYFGQIMSLAVPRNGKN